MRTTLIGVTALLLSCGLGPLSEEGGGSDNLPIHGGGPFTPLPVDFDTAADEPYVVVEPTSSLLDPSVEELASGGFLIHYTRLTENGSEIWKSVLPDVTQFPGASEPVLSADQDWEQGQVRSVSLLREGERVTLYYEGGVAERAIGRAVSADGGRTYQKDSDNPILVGLDPHVTRSVSGQTLLVYADRENTKILLRESSDGVGFGPAREILRSRSSLVGAIDEAGVAAPALRIETNLSGQEHYGLYYTGWSLDSDDEIFESIGYLASFGGITWQRFLDGEAIVDPGLFGTGGAAPVIGPVSGLLFFHQKRQGRGRIAVAAGP